MQALCFIAATNVYRLLCTFLGFCYEVQSWRMYKYSPLYVQILLLYSSLACWKYPQTVLTAFATSLTLYLTMCKQPIRLSQCFTIFYTNQDTLYHSQLKTQSHYSCCSDLPLHLMVLNNKFFTDYLFVYLMSRVHTTFILQQITYSTNGVGKLLFEKLRMFGIFQDDERCLQPNIWEEAERKPKVFCQLKIETNWCRKKSTGPVQCLLFCVPKLMWF